MNASNTIKAFTDAAADAVGRELAAIRREAQREREIRDAEHRAKLAELETRILTAADIERRLDERLALLKDGEPGAPGKDADLDQIIAKLSDPISDAVSRETGRQVAEAIASIPVPKDGQDVEDIAVTQDGAVVEFAFQVGETRSIFEIELPQGPAGEQGEKGDHGPAGHLPAVEVWVDKVHYAGDVRSHAGATWQALKDTAREPPHDDWACLAARGTDGLSLNPLGLHNAETEYRRNDVVALNGNSFVAVRDDPGACPGDGWKLLAQKGKPGEKGERGPKGDVGPAGPAVVAMNIDDNAMLTLINGDGSIVQCDLYPLLSRLD